VEVANNEHSLYQKIYTESLNGLIADFWKIDKHIPYRYAFKLIQLLPFKTKIVGNYNLTAEALQFILGEDVNIDIDFCEPATNEIQSTDLGGILGESYLGSDFVMGSSISGYVASVIINVGPIKNSQPMDFHANGIAERLIKAFVGYFVPMEYDVYTKLLIEKDMSSLVLSVDEEAVASHLGFNSVL
jgi:hypothetical protein